jgi:AcrR family transcriptional regulator
MASRPERLRALERMRSETAAFDWSRLTDGRRRVLEAFLRIATTSGYANVTMRALGRQVNMKAPSLYSHFPGGRDEVVSEALRWHYSQFAQAVIEALERTDDAVHFWTALIDQHVRRQLEMLENDMFDLMLATDRISGFLPETARAEITHLVRLDTELFLGAAHDMGYTGDVEGAIAVVLTILDGVRGWSDWNGRAASLDEIIATAVRLSFGVLEVCAQAPTSAIDRAGVRG